MSVKHLLKKEPLGYERNPLSYIFSGLYIKRFSKNIPVTFLGVFLLGGVLNIGKDISDNNYCKISTIDKTTENWYNLVNWKCDSYNFQYSNKIGIYFIKDGDLVCDAVYLNTFAHFKQWYAFYGIETKENNFQVE